MSFVAIDCFAGAGGLSIGLTQAGIRVVAAFDSNETAVLTYRRNLGHHVICARAEDTRGETLLKVAGTPSGSCDLVVGGPPCQGFSQQRRGRDHDKRNDLIFEFLRLIEELAPKMFLMENVPAIAGQRGRFHFEEFLRRAHKLGYHTHGRILDAAAYGVPQHRLRYFLVGERDDGQELFSFPKPTHAPSHYRTVREAIGDLPSPVSAPDQARLFPNHDPDRISDLNRLRIAHVPPGGGRDHIPLELRLPCHSVSVEKAGHRYVYGRLAWDEPAGTITTKCNSFTRGKFAHPAENRNISMREAARLQGFPDTFIFEGSKVDVAHQIGNAVPPPLAALLGRSIALALALRSGSAQPLTPSRQLSILGLAPQ